MYTYSILPLDESHFDEICADARDQYRRGISSCPMFMMILVPEGTPVWDKVGPLCKVFARFRDALAADGIPAGVLVQASLGHCYTLVPTPYQHYINLTDGKEIHVHCPYDPDFRAHFRDVMRQIACERPAAIMLDDDFRLLMREGRGCACPLHMKEFNRRAGTNLTREALYAHIMSHDATDPLTHLFLDTQRDAMIEAIRDFRAGIDSVDPTIQGINCTSGDLCEAVDFTAPIFCGKGNPKMARLPNGTYAPLSVRGISDTARRAAVCASRLKKRGIDVVLAETDTIPFNRYGKSARYLHTHYTTSILEGLEGAKHWITRLSAHEPDSGKAYRDILAKHHAFYETLSGLSKQLQWVGCNVAFTEQPQFYHQKEDMWTYQTCAWATKVLERMGLPFYFSDRSENAVFLEGINVAAMPKEQLEAYRNASLFVSCDAAQTLIQRGYGDLLGVDVRPWKGDFISGETFDGTDHQSCNTQKNPMELCPNREGVEAMTYNYHQNSDKAEILFPASTVYRRENGKLTTVFCGTPDAEYNYMEGFGFLHESRKKQFVSLLKEANALPVYYDGDNEVCLRAGTLSDGSLLVCTTILGYDPMEALPLVLQTQPTAIEILQPDGTFAPVAWEWDGERCLVALRVEPLYPVVLRII